jgi:DNA invertase Pin-like site-specific DNA recombinase
MVDNRSIVIYARVSTEEQTQNYSIDAQREQCGHCGKVVASYVESASGADVSRPTLRQAIESAKRSNAWLCVASVSRLGRLAWFNAQLYEMMKGKIISASEGVFDSHAGKLQFIILSAVAEFELSLIRDRQCKSLEIKSDLRILHITQLITQQTDAGLSRLSNSFFTLREVASWLNKYEIPTMSGRGQWSANSVRRFKMKLSQMSSVNQEISSMLSAT